MRSVILALSWATLVGCTATGGAPGPTAQSAKPASRSPAGASTSSSSESVAAADKKRSCEQAITDHQNAAVLGSALSMAGGLGGLGGYDGAVAGQVASTAGSMLSASQSATTRAAVQRECGAGSVL